MFGGVSYNGITYNEIVGLGYNYVFVKDVTYWCHFKFRDDGKADWIKDRDLVEDRDFYSDILVSGLEMTEVWGFKDPETAMLFKLTWM